MEGDCGPEADSALTNDNAQLFLKVDNEGGAHLCKRDRETLARIEAKLDRLDMLLVPSATIVADPCTVKP